MGDLRIAPRAAEQRKRIRQQVMRHAQANRRLILLSYFRDPPDRVITRVTVITGPLLLIVL